MNIIKSLPPSFPDNTYVITSRKDITSESLNVIINSSKAGISNAIDRFWSKVNRQSNNNCWEWTGAKRGKGYGALRIFHATCDAHRLSWIIHFGDIPDGLFVLHHCDNPSCVNPNHLFLGAQKDNTDDKVKKNRQLKGEQIYWSKLTESIVLEIRKLHDTGMPHKEIAKTLNIHVSRISPIVLRKEWKHI